MVVAGWPKASSPAFIAVGAVVNSGIK